jgi:hypothetical protein
MDALLNEQVGIKHYQAERERQNIVAGANFEEFADRIQTLQLLFVKRAQRLGLSVRHCAPVGNPGARTEVG